MNEYVKIAKDIERSIKERVGSTIVVMQKDATRIFKGICGEVGLVATDVAPGSFVAFLCNECRTNDRLNKALDTHLLAEWETLGGLGDGIAILERHL